MIVSSTVVAAARAGADAFVQIQRSRLDQTAIGRGLRSDQSSLLLGRLTVMEDQMDVATKELWDITTSVFFAMESQIDSVNASQMYLQWYQEHFVDAERLARAATVLESSDACADNLEGLWGPYFTATLRSFLAGLFPRTADLFSAALRFLRANVANCFTLEEECCLTSVVRLLGAPPQCNSEFVAWQRDANCYVKDARYVLEPSADSLDTAPQRLKQLALDLLLMMGGDMPLIRESCISLQLTALDFSASFLSLVRPFSTMYDVHRLVATTAAQWKSATVWYTDIVVALLGCREPVEVVHAMELVGTAVSKVAWSCDEDSPANRSFCLLFMAAHLSDIALDAVLLPMPNTPCCFVRNELVVSYTQLFASHPALWKTAAMYVAFSPLVNPVHIRDLVVACGSTAVNDERRMENFELFMRLYLNAGSPLQRQLRSQAGRVLDGSKTLEKWTDAFDAAVAEGTKMVRIESITLKWKHKHFAAAVWEAVETSLTSAVQHQLTQWLAAPLTAETTEALAAIGEAVHCGHIAIERARPAAFATILHLLASFTFVALRRQSAVTTFIVQATPSERIDGATAVLMRGGDRLLHSTTLLQLCETVLELAASGTNEPHNDAIVKVNTALSRLTLQNVNPHDRVDAQRVNAMRKKAVMLLASGRLSEV